MTPLERLLAEAIPTGLFGGLREPAAFTADEQARHRAVLYAAATVHRVGRPMRDARHLRLVTTPSRANAEAAQPRQRPLARSEGAA